MTAHPALLGQRYRLVERIGAGGMAVVWRAHDQVLHRGVAVKMLAPHLAAQPENLQLLRAEALAVAGLAHPHLTGVYDYGHHQVDGHDQPYLVMELVEGITLRQRLHDDLTGLSWQTAASITAQTAAALAAAHARGIVHRDITPANIMLTAAGAKVLDFGICVLAGEQDGPDGELVGTVDYIAPERVTGSQAVTPACDVYALGMVWYQCLSGRLPWDCTTPTGRLREHVLSPPDALPPIPGMPAPIIDLCLRCLAKNPADRPTAAELAAQLAPWNTPDTPAAQAEDRDESTRLLAMPVAYTRPAPRRPVGVAARMAATVRAVPRHRRAAISAGAVGAVALAGVLWLDTGSADPASADAASCHVSYDARTDDTGYAAVLTVSTAEQRLHPWRLTFTVADGWQVAASRSATIRQAGGQVVVTGPAELAAGRPFTVELTGQAPGSAPARFRLNDTTCQSDVNVLRTVPTPAVVAKTPPGRPPKPAATPEQHGKGNGKDKKKP